jgi:MFS family permease
MLTSSATSLLTVTFTEARERARAFGVYGAVASGGAAIGLVLGGVLTEFASWRRTLLINVPIALFAAIAVSRVIRESRAGARRGYDLPGAVTATGGLFLLVYGFTMVASHGWGSTLTVTLFAGALALLAAFVAIELRSPHPLLPMRVVLEKRRGGSLLASLLGAARCSTRSCS